MSSVADDDIFDDELDNVFPDSEQPKQLSKMRRIEELMEQKKLLQELDDFADDEPVNYGDYNSDIDVEDE